MAVLGNNAGSVVLVVVVGAGNAVLVSGADAFLTSVVTFSAFLFVTFVEVAVGAVHDASSFALDEEVADGTGIASSVFVAGNTSAGAFDAGVVGSFSVSDRAGGNASVLVEFSGHSAIDALVDIGGASTAVLVGASNAETVELDFAFGAGVDALVVVKAESGDTLGADVFADAAQAGGVTVYAFSGSGEGLLRAGGLADALVK
jgi:hypothetical protein